MGHQIIFADSKFSSKRHQILGGKKAIQFTLQGFPTFPEGAPAGNSGSLAVHKTAQSGYRPAKV